MLTSTVSQNKSLPEKLPRGRRNHILHFMKKKKKKETKTDCSYFEDRCFEMYHLSLSYSSHL